ncbi:unnamed protein product [Anisakis simplex]|uniref:Uncharacterized protein n=1 Tax=Anisakis simplex TaxID=6269 RepID=A0A0M3JNY4_ANISI|nr:unnamed protein product [Anisakis simplex]
MDSRVGAIIADVLYEIQKGTADERRERHSKNLAFESKENLKNEPASDYVDSCKSLKQQLSSASSSSRNNGSNSDSEKATNNNSSEKASSSEQQSRKRSASDAETNDALSEGLFLM